MILLKIVVALLMIAIIAVGSIMWNIVGYLITLGMTIILNGMLHRWDAKTSVK
ncbi:MULTISPECIES: hypothetical protein [Aeromonas]|uniref:hypothetical protein n=1 Tax=Aeromonas TaxID=642 RepID=UPI001BFCCEE4|nr:hypothetical protein [Aeromonas dhakensis]HDT5887711.1 hypothetical protein [Aeromonas dhakensis]HEB4979180.1 hypothetical protein [Aeromonas dhakensis]